MRDGYFLIFITYNLNIYFFRLLLNLIAVNIHFLFPLEESKANIELADSMCRMSRDEPVIPDCKVALGDN